MSKHVSEWLSAYHDGELRGNRLHHLEAHLAECELCQTELESLEQVSSLLHEVPTPEFTPPERFAAQVKLRLPHQKITISRTQILEIGWWMIPVGLLATWLFASVLFLLGDVLSAAHNLGLVHSISGWLVIGSSANASWSETLGQLGILSGNNLSWAEATEAFTRMSLPRISLQVSIALLYLSWIAIWWARRTPPREQGLLLEG
jgi:predicted anti-sigma-YlaC factor YlaD